jgi:gamma-glutamyl phosphate reductase
MKTKIAIACIIAAAVAVPTMIQQKTVSQLREQNVALQQQLVQLNTTVEDTGRLTAAPVDVRQLERQNNEHAELLQLRGEVGRLRKQLATQSADFENQRDMLENAKKIRIETVNAMKQLALAARLFAADNNHKYPARFEE